MIETKKKEFKQLILYYIIITKISTIIQFYLFIQLYQVINFNLFIYSYKIQQYFIQEYTLWENIQFIFYHCVARYASFACAARLPNLDEKKSLILVLLFCDDFYAYQELDRPNNPINQNLIPQDNFKQKFIDLFELLFMNNCLLVTTKLFAFSWTVQFESSTNEILSFFILAHLAIDYYILQMDGLFNLNYNVLQDIEGFQQMMLQEICITIINFISLIKLIQENFQLTYFIQIYVIYNIALVWFYYQSLKHRINYFQNKFLFYVLIIKFLFHVDVGSRIYGKNQRQLQSIGGITLNSTIKYSLLQKIFLIIAFIYKLETAENITFYQQFLISLSILSFVIYSIKYCYYIDIWNKNQPRTIEIDNFYDLKRNMQMWNNINERNYFKNLQTVYIYIRQDQCVNESDLIQCLFCCFGNSEIISYSYSRLKVKNQNFFFKVKIEEQIQNSSFINGLQDKKTLSQINLFKIAIANKDQLLVIIEYLIINNIKLKLKNLSFMNDDLFSYILQTGYNGYIDYQEITLMQILVFKYQIATEQIYNPNIIFYDLYN